MADQNSDSRSGGLEAADQRRNPADNLTRDARIRGGERSARLQQRDARGQFAGRKNEGGESRKQSAGRNAGEPKGENR